jgi:hypothetical protein
MRLVIPVLILLLAVSCLDGLSLHEVTTTILEAPDTLESLGKPPEMPFDYAICGEHLFVRFMRRINEQPSGIWSPKRSDYICEVRVFDRVGHDLGRLGNGFTRLPGGLMQPAELVVADSLLWVLDGDEYDVFNPDNLRFLYSIDCGQAPPQYPLVIGNRVFSRWTAYNEEIGLDSLMSAFHLGPDSEFPPNQLLVHDRYFFDQTRLQAEAGFPAFADSTRKRFGEEIPNSVIQIRWDICTAGSFSMGHVCRQDSSLWVTGNYGTELRQYDMTLHELKRIPVPFLSTLRQEEFPHLSKHMGNPWNFFSYPLMILPLTDGTLILVVRVSPLSGGSESNEWALIRIDTATGKCSEPLHTPWAIKAVHDGRLIAFSTENSRFVLHELELIP